MQKKTNDKKQKNITLKAIILTIILAIIILLILFAEDIVKLQNKDKLNIAQSKDSTSNITIAPNIPKISAGMIPVKWDGNYWVITTQEDTDWYNYASGKPAYIMLNDGVYQSELISNMVGKKLAQENIGAQIQETELGTIYMWIPRFEINNNSKEIKYTKEIEQAEEGYIIPDLFIHKQTHETKPDFLLTGAWVEKTPLSSTSELTNKVNNMNGENNIYGFIANTVGENANNDTTYKDAIPKYLEWAGLNQEQLTDLTSTNRTILKVINPNYRDPIKATANFQKTEGKIKVQVTYRENEIQKIIFQGTTELNFTKENGIITADTTGIELEDGESIITIVDNKGNRKELTVQVICGLYATLYTDGTLAFGKSENPIPEKTISVKYEDISGKEYANPWYSARTNITTVDFVNKVSPNSTANWFYECSKLTTIYRIENLNTSNVTNMGSMFFGCSSLTELNVRNFGTSKVTYMNDMFRGCSNLTKLDLSNFDTSNVTSMYAMFYGCSSLAELDVRNFDTSKVTVMQSTFALCSSLTELDLSNFDTSKVKNMKWMFGNSRNLKTIYVGSKWKLASDREGMFYRCGTSTTTRK